MNVSVNSLIIQMPNLDLHFGEHSQKLVGGGGGGTDEKLGVPPKKKLEVKGECLKNINTLKGGTLGNENKNCH